MLNFIDKVEIVAFTLGVASLMYSFLILLKKNYVIKLNLFINGVMPFIITAFVVPDSYYYFSIIYGVSIILLMNMFSRQYVIYHPKEIELKNIIINVFNSHNIEYKEFKNEDSFSLNFYLKETLVTADINKNSLAIKSDIKFEKKDINEIISFINEYLKNNKNNAWKRYFLVYIFTSLICFLIYFLA